MSQQNFIPVSGATHLTFRNIFNANANDAESRLGSIEPHFTQQSISSSAGVLALDVTGGYSATTTLTEDVTGFSITNSTSGDSGLVVVKQDNTAAWTFSSSQTVLVGDLADVASITASGSGVGTVCWYDDGSDQYLYMSDVT